MYACQQEVVGRGRFRIERGSHRGGGRGHGRDELAVGAVGCGGDWGLRGGCRGVGGSAGCGLF